MGGSDSKNTATFAHRSTRVTKVAFAYGKVAGGTGALTDGINVTSATRTGAGVYDVVLTTGIAVTNRRVVVTCRDAVAGIINVTAQPSATAFTISTFDATPAPADRDFEFSVDQITS